MSVTYLIAGPMSQRNLNNPCAQINSINQELKNVSPEHSMRISTTSSIDAQLQPYLHMDVNFILSNDPGDDYRKHYPWRNRDIWNLTRMYTSVNKGLKGLETHWTIKTRVELLPNIRDVNRHVRTVIGIIKELESSTGGSIAFPEEDYWGPSRPRKGVMYWLPDTFQIMRTNEMQKLWADAQKIAESYLQSEYWHERNALSSEQILGSSYFKNFINGNFRQPNQRFDFNFRDFKDAHKAESKLFLIIPYNNLYLQESKFTKRNEINAVIYREEVKFVKNAYQACFRFAIYRLLNRRTPSLFAAITSVRMKLRNIN